MLEFDAYPHIVCSEWFIVKVLIGTNIMEINILGDAHLKPDANGKTK